MEIIISTFLKSAVNKDKINRLYKVFLLSIGKSEKVFFEKVF